MAGPTGVEPATLGLKVRCSVLTELRTHLLSAVDRKTLKGFFSVSVVFCKTINKVMIYQAFFELVVILFCLLYSATV